MKDCIKNIKNIINNNINDNKYDELNNILKDKTINLYSCGNSFLNNYQKLPNNIDSINVCIKTTIDYIKDCDIFVYDNRIRAGDRKKKIYEFNKNEILTIFFSDNYFNNYYDYLKNLRPVYQFDINEEKFMSPDLKFSTNNKYNINNIDNISIKSYIENDIIYGNNDIFVPLVYKLILLFKHMGVKNFNICGWDNIDDNFSQAHYFNKKENNIIGLDTFHSIYYSLILNYNDLDITLYSNGNGVSNEIKRYKDFNLNNNLNNLIKVFFDNILINNNYFNYLMNKLNKYELFLMSYIFYLHYNKIKIFKFNDNKENFFIDKDLNHIINYFYNYFYKNIDINLNSIIIAYQEYLLKN